MPKNVTFPKCIGYTWNKDFDQYLLEILAKNDSCSINEVKEKLIKYEEMFNSLCMQWRDSNLTDYSFYDHKDETFSIDKIKDVLETYKNNLKCFDSRIMLKISYPIKQQSLRSGLEGYQYYDVVFEGDLTKEGEFKKYIHFDFVYSSACPCSFELSEHAEKYRNRATVPHSQRSVARVSVRFEDMLWIEDIQELCLDALQTETQVMVKREDEQAFAEKNGAY